MTTLLDNKAQRKVGDALGKSIQTNLRARHRELFDAQDAIDVQREELIVNIEKQLKHTSAIQALFTIHWRLT